MSRIRLTSGRHEPARSIEPAPFEQSIRWCSPYEHNDELEYPLIFLTQDAYRAINDHAESDLSREVGGMLLGQIRQTLRGQPYVIVEMPLAADHVDHGPAHLTFTSDTLTALLNQQEDDHPDKQIVGWFHTHPGLSVFLSSYDTFLHQNFFPQAWHVALVIDPRASHAGWFRYKNGDRAHLDPHDYVGFYELVEGSESIAAWENLTRS